jgi:hypothetical protein
MTEQKKRKKPRDINKLAHYIVNESTREESDDERKREKNPAAVELGRLGGLKGGKARAAKLSSEKRTEIARRAARARWKTSEEDALRCALGEYAYIPTAKEAIRYLSDETKEAEIEEETKEEAEKGDAKEVKGECDEEAIKKTS